MDGSCSSEMRVGEEVIHNLEFFSHLPCLCVNFLHLFRRRVLWVKLFSFCLCWTLIRIYCKQQFKGKYIKIDVLMDDLRPKVNLPFPLNKHILYCLYLWPCTVDRSLIFFGLKWPLWKSSRRRRCGFLSSENRCFFFCCCCCDTKCISDCVSPFCHNGQDLDKAENGRKVCAY